jgi:D-aminoacyl-tRNA deacylase
MKFAVLYSKKDLAGLNIAERLKTQFLPHVPIIELKKESIYEENIDQELSELKNIDFIIFATKHASKAGGKTLSLHAPGNWRNADFGGKSGKVCKTSALVIKYLFQKMSEHLLTSGLDYNLTLECTHHGPLIEKPCLFIEIGAQEQQWQDKSAANIIAKSISDLQNFEAWKEKIGKEIKIAIGIGGPHYCPNFNKIQLSNLSKIAISHIIAEHHLPLNESMLNEAIEKTKEHTKFVILDWKGCGISEERQKVIETINKAGLEILRTDQIKK